MIYFVRATKYETLDIEGKITWGSIAFDKNYLICLTQSDESFIQNVFNFSQMLSGSFRS
jgi:hypothetical protein